MTLLAPPETVYLFPPEKLRAALEDHRSRGNTFKAAWPAAQCQALEGQPAATVVFWRGAWREQRHCWLLAYSRTRWPAQSPHFVLDYGDESKDANGRGPAPICI